jgi:hypothetical protein
VLRVFIVFACNRNMAANLGVLEDPMGAGYMVKIPSPSLQVFYELANFLGISPTDQIERVNGLQVENRFGGTSNRGVHENSTVMEKASVQRDLQQLHASRFVHR